MRLLAIETSCDETALALVECSGDLENPRFKVLESVVASQIPLHRRFGGVVPNLAKREHLKNLPLIFEKIGGESLKDITDAVVVTVGPGLEPALWTGIEFAKGLAKRWKKPLIGASHLQGHLYSFLLERKESLEDVFPSASLVVSGGHTILLILQSLVKYKKLGETRDDAAGEAFDKAARLLRLPYPGGPEIEKAAKKGNSEAVAFPRPMIYEKNYDFSFSGLKTSLLYHIKQSFKADWKEFNKNYSQNGIKLENTDDVAASFQQALVDSLVYKTTRAAREFQTKSIGVSGGVAANSLLRNSLKKEAKKLGIAFLSAGKKWNTDNAAMIAVAGYVNFLNKKRLKIEAQPNLGL
ncbi:MAG TPA: tRNA (adenosine(37)-N6)-threonylcarbamoyltransferase complex transferase subunit TsaD [Candidatus Colwellbacteria bacterium]|nr:tRNA (adenosine(37)-N6)-threonylcarbamoyltransferase complex transferase subunit TsaD [Candidatus Colwellbacteria bacterium]